MTNTQNIISTTEARRRIFGLTKDVQRPGNHYILTENGKSKAVILSAKEYENIQSTIESLTEDPDLPELIAEADEAVRTDDFSNYISFDDFLKEEGYVVAEKGGEYVVQHTTKQRGKKKLSQTTPKNKKQSK